MAKGKYIPYIPGVGHSPSGGYWNRRVNSVNSLGSSNEPSGNGSSVTVFEVTDLVVPAGTLWIGNDNTYLMGTIDADWAGGILCVEYIEVAEPAADRIGLELVINDDENRSFDSTRIDGGGPEVWSQSGGFGTVFPLAYDQALGDLPKDVPPPAGPTTVSARIFARGLATGTTPTTEDITIVRARAALMFI